MTPEYALRFEIAKLVFSSLALLSLVVAYLAYRVNLQKQDDERTRDADKELLAQAQKSLEWAYNSLTDGGVNVPPKPDRMNWLTSARHLLRHKCIAQRIRSDTYRIVQAEHEEFWRHRFYLALDHNSLVSPGYYSAPESQPWPENIEVSSALVVVSFCKWSRDYRDPTEDVDREAILNDPDALKGRAGRGLRAYIERFAVASARG